MKISRIAIALGLMIGQTATAGQDPFQGTSLHWPTGDGSTYSANISNLVNIHVAQNPWNKSPILLTAAQNTFVLKLVKDGELLLEVGRSYSRFGKDFSTCNVYRDSRGALRSLNPGGMLYGVMYKSCAEASGQLDKKVIPITKGSTYAEQEYDLHNSDMENVRVFLLVDSKAKGECEEAIRKGGAIAKGIRSYGPSYEWNETTNSARVVQGATQDILRLRGLEKAGFSDDSVSDYYANRVVTMTGGPNGSTYKRYYFDVTYQSTIVLRVGKNCRIGKN